MNSTETDPLAEVSTKPKLSELITEYERSGVQSGWWSDSAVDTRLMRWDGQSTDGRKHAQDTGSDVFPWENAFDTRVPVVDRIIRFLVSVLLSAYERAQLRCAPVEASDVESAATVQKLLEYYRNAMRRQLREELELTLQSAKTWGACLIQCVWERTLNSRTKTLTMDELVMGAQELAAQQPEHPMAALPQYILDPAMEEFAVELLMQFIPALNTKAAARRVVRGLRNEGQGQWREPYTVYAGPCVSALRIGRDVFFPPETTDLQRARVIFRRDFLTTVELRERIVTMDWNPAWVAEAEKTAGKSSVWTNTDPDVATTKTGWTGYSFLETQNNLVEVVHAYTRQLDENHIPQITCTVFSPHVTTRTGHAADELVAAHYPMDDAHGQYPFIAYQSERWSRRLLASRGVAEIAQTWQNEEKAQRDMLADLASVSVNPTLAIGDGNRTQRYQTGPGAQILARQAQFLTPPTTNAPLAFNVIEMLRKQAGEYFGMMQEDVAPPLWQAILQNEANNFLGAVEELFTQMAALILDERNISTEELERVTGISLEGMDRSPEAIARKYDFTVSFDARDLDMEYTLQKLKLIGDMAAQWDRAGVVDWAKIMAMGMSAVDPTFARALVSDQQGATRRIFDDVDREVGRMALGNEANYVENDPTAATKMDFLGKLVQANPRYQAQLQQDERFRELMENYQKNLQQSIAQQENVQTGKTGVKPVGA